MVTVGLAIQTVRAEVECPRCRSRYILLADGKCSCRQCGNVWDANRPPRKVQASTTRGCLRCAFLKRKGVDGE